MIMTQEVSVKEVSDSDKSITTPEFNKLNLI